MPQVFSIENNKIAKVPESIYFTTTLKDLRVSHNQLTSVQDAIGQLKNLRTYHVTGNKVGIDNGGQLPPDIGKCQFLEELHLDENEILDLPWELGTASRRFTTAFYSYRSSNTDTEAALQVLSRH